MPKDQITPTYRVVGVRADGVRITVVLRAGKEVAERVADRLTADNEFDRIEIEEEDRGH